MAAPNRPDVGPARGPRGLVPAANRSVVQVVQSFGRGGLEALSVNLAVGLRDVGVRPIMVALEEGGVLENVLSREGIEHEIIGRGRYRDPRTHRRLSQLFASSRPQAVHTHHFAALASSVATARLARVPTLVHTEHAFQYLEARPGLHRPLRWMSRFVDSFVVVGAEMRDYYVDRVGVAPARMRVIPNGVDTVRYRPTTDRAAARARAGLPNATLVGTAGRFAAVKNYPMLVTAVAAVRQSRPDVHLVMCGDGDERGALERLAGELGIADAVHFLGWRTDLADVVSCLDVFALTSWTEGLPLVVLEAMACALPVVSTEVGDVPRLVMHGRTGLLVPTGDATALAGALASLADDAARREAIGRAGHAFVTEHYSQREMVRQYLASYGLEPN